MFKCYYSTNQFTYPLEQFNMFGVDFSSLLNKHIKRMMDTGRKGGTFSPHNKIHFMIQILSENKVEINAMGGSLEALAKLKLEAK